MTTQRTCWVIIPAAGTGTRMAAHIPKQYLTLSGKTVIEHTVARMLQLKPLAGIVVVLAEQDSHWQTLPLATLDIIHTTVGGPERCVSVLNGLRYLEHLAAADDLVLVHDAARPCVRISDILTLVGTAATSKDGAILAAPVRDTLKRAGIDGSVEATVDRDRLWHALTPQVFRLSLLREALETARSRNIPVTDDAQAVELIGGHPVLVQGHADNIKITSPADLALARLYLQNQEPSK